MLENTQQTMSADQLCSHGYSLAIDGKIEDAITVWREVISLDQSHAVAHYNLGATLYDLGKSEEALAEFYRAVSVEPSFADAHERIGYTFHMRARESGETSDYRSALAAYRRAVQSGTKEATLFFTIGDIARYLRDNRLAVDSLRTAVSLDPDFERAYYELARMYFKSFQWRRLLEAISALARCSTFDESNYSIDWKTLIRLASKVVLSLAGLIFLLRFFQRRGSN